MNYFLEEAKETEEAFTKLKGLHIVQEPSGWVVQFIDIAADYNQDFVVIYKILDAKEYQYDRFCQGITNYLYIMPIDEWLKLTPVEKVEIWQARIV